MMTIEALHNKFLECGCKLTTDSRMIVPGCIFLALKGENFDGNNFAFTALEDGASYCVVSEGSAAALSGEPRMLVFSDTLAALQMLACYHREHTLHKGKRIPMLALTGTNGKTTTKELTKAVMSEKYCLTATEGNLNNNIGVPLTLLNITTDTEFAIVEMGASHPGDIKELVDIAHPDFGLITNVGKAHLLGFGSFEGVKRTKGELYDYISSIEGKCFVNQDSADLTAMAAARTGLETIPYGLKYAGAEVLAVDTEHPMLRIKKEGECLCTNLVGSYNADNVMAALAVGEYFGVDRQAALAAIAFYVPKNKRSQMEKTADNTLIVDAYNANPSSMEAALSNFEHVLAQCKAVMLGDMLELGEDSRAEHAKVLARVVAMGVKQAVFVGNEFAKASADVQDAADFLYFATSAEAAQYFEQHPLKGYTILVKGSRGTRMERLIPVL